MAKLTARGRRTWVRGHRTDPSTGDVVVVAFMSDGSVLERRVGRWKVKARWNRLTPIGQIRQQLIQDGFVLEAADCTNHQLLQVLDFSPPDYRGRLPVPTKRRAARRGGRR